MIVPEHIEARWPRTIATIGLWRRPQERLVMTKAVIVFISLFSIVQAQSTVPPSPRFPGDQHLTTIFGIWSSDTGPLQVEDFGGRSLLVASDRDLLMRALERGHVVIRGGGGSNTAGIESPRARMIVLFTGVLT